MLRKRERDRERERERGRERESEKRRERGREGERERAAALRIESTSRLISCRAYVLQEQGRMGKCTLRTRQLSLH